MEYKEIEQLVREQAFKVAKVTDVVVKFSNRMNKSYALCYWQETPQEIHFNKKFIDANKNNYSVLYELIVHECIHLIPGYNRHNKKFFEKCKSFGVEPYGFSSNYISVDPLFITNCNNCFHTKKYFIKPKVTKCEFCKEELLIIDCRGKHGD